MADTYTRENFNPKVIPGGMTKEHRNLIIEAIEWGWTFRVRGLTAKLISPDDSPKTISLSASGGNTPFKRYHRMIHAHGIPPTKPETAVGEALQTAAIQAERKKVTRKAVKKTVAKKAVEPLPKPVEKEPEVQSTEPKRFIVSEGPMIAHLSQNGKGYLSDSTIERRWSDGTVEYACAVPGCDFTSKSRLGPSRGHRQKHINAGEVEAKGKSGGRNIVTIEPYEPAYTREWSPRRDRIEALTAAIRAAMEEGLDWSNLDHAAEKLAEAALTWTHEQSSAGTGLAGEREPLTDAEMLNRIRAMLDNGLYLRQQDEIAALRTRVEEVEAEAAAAKTDAQKAKDTLRTFRELASEYDEGESA